MRVESKYTSGGASATVEAADASSKEDLSPALLDVVCHKKIQKNPGPIQADTTLVTSIELPGGS
jgi:hypothetical protein